MLMVTAIHPVFSHTLTFNITQSNQRKGSTGGDIHVRKSLIFQILRMYGTSEVIWLNLPYRSRTLVPRAQKLVPLAVNEWIYSQRSPAYMAGHFLGV